ncbi:MULTISPECIES: MDR family MFS transporter [Rhizobium]|uniref:EmrB/QacA subfamily drug resistance transporter n=1 Tax=Rhizobium paranaense TaxID=1650438 RepID=A0A7W8XQL6_9HYPH|nr:MULTISPECIES: MDR family MFS transporter [Rhizobium]MBB5573775.1 EmrB/QacA subfamily drug resistance transporter [Rhizobium paranaense]PST61495.1 MFS transporter [Rhizobium sp. SEMIA4064]
MDMQVTHAPLVADHRRRLILFLFLMTAMFMATLDNQIVSTALPTIVGEFGHLERFGWIGSAYLLALSASMPVYGKLGDLFGRKYVMMTAIAIFTVGSAVCGLAVSMNTLIAARVLQGLGGGGILVSIFAVNADLFEPRERARYQSYSSLVLMASGAIGPVLGGTMSDLFGWRSIFLVNVPIGFIVLTGLALMLPYRKPARKPKIDYAGALLLALTTTSIVLAADGTELFGSLLSPQCLGIIAFGAFCALAWVFVERRAPEPIVPMTLFRNPTFGLLLIISVTSGAVAIGMVNYFALFLQTTTGLSPSMAGLLFILLTGGIVCGSLSAGRLISARGRYKPFAIASAACSTIAFATLAQVHAGTPIVFIGALMLLHGIGIGLAQQVPVIGVQNAAARGDVGAATGAVTLSRMGGASIAISIYGAIIAAKLSNIGLSIPGVANIEELTPKMMAALPEATRESVANAYASAFSPLFMTAAAICFLGLLTAIILKNVQLPSAAKKLDSQAAAHAAE